MACTWTPSASRSDATSFQPALSANAPWTSATAGPESLGDGASVMVSPCSLGRLALSGDGPGGLGPSRRSARQEGEQISVELLLVGPVQAVRRSGVDLELGVLQEVDRLPGRRTDRHDLVVVPVGDERRDVDGLQVLG